MMEQWGDPWGGGRQEGAVITCCRGGGGGEGRMRRGKERSGRVLARPGVSGE